MGKVEKVARAICVARGRDPDAQSPRAPQGSWNEQRGNVSVSHLGPLQMPTWREFEDEATVFLAAYEAANE